MSDTVRFVLGESDLPSTWYNINTNMPVPSTPVLHPVTQEPVTPDFLSALFPMPLIAQEVSTARHIEIPQAIQANAVVVVTDVFAVRRADPAAAEREPHTGRKPCYSQLTL